jgi:hypothetical protein
MFAVLVVLVVVVLQTQLAPLALHPLPLRLRHLAAAGLGDAVLGRGQTALSRAIRIAGIARAALDDLVEIGIAEHARYGQLL